MKTYIQYSVVSILLALSLTFAQQNENQSFSFAQAFRGDAREMGLMAGLFCINNFYLSKTTVWSEPPLLETKTSGPLMESSVSTKTLYGAGFFLSAAILHLPNNQGKLNSISYRHFKGFTESVLVITPFITEIAKLSFGKKRPNYQAALTANSTMSDMEESEYRRSFWSGHSSAAFAMSTYFNLFLYQHGKMNKGRKLILISVSTGLAAYTARSRVLDYQHETIDVVVGSIVGTMISSTIYGYHEGWFSFGGKNSASSSNSSQYHFQLSPTAFSFIRFF